MPPEVRGYLGGTVQLPCHLLPPGPEVRVSQVTWLHVDAAGVSKSVAAFHPSYGPSFRSPKPGEERLSFVTAGQSAGTRQGTEMDLRDATLALRGLTVDDEGNYTCEFATFPSGTSRGVTWLKAIGEQCGESGNRRSPPSWIPFSLGFSCDIDFPYGLRSVSKYLLSTYCMSDSILQVEDTAVPKAFKSID